MLPESNLQILLRNMNPVLNEGLYVFCTCNDLSLFSQEELVMSFNEPEGITVILRKETADRLHLEYSFVAAWITLKVYSSLEAVGLTACVSNALSSAGISCNVIAAYHHDHIFVKSDDAAAALEILCSISG